MAHEIEGNYAFYASSTPAWHGLGTVLKDAPTGAEGWKLAYPFDLFKLSAFAGIPDDSGTIQTIEAPETRFIVRSDGKILGPVGEGYEVVQPWQIMTQFDHIREEGLLELEAGGSLYEGRSMWSLWKVPGTETEIVKNDMVKAYMLVTTGLAGNGSLLMGATGTRAVCANTVRMAIAAGLQYSFRHTKSIHDRIDEASVEIEKVTRAWKETTEVYKALARKKVSRNAQEKYVRHVLVGENSDDNELKVRTENRVNHVIELLDTQKGLELVPAIRGTAWQAYNAITEYITHEAGNSPETRLQSQWLGAGVKQNDKALQLAMTM